MSQNGAVPFLVGPVPIAPVRTDFSECDPFYGTTLQYSDCVMAVDSMPSGETMFIYHILDRQSSDLPYSIAHGTCMISIDVAGPVLPTEMYFSPNEIRGMASWVIQQCVSARAGMGGFITKDLNNMLSYLAVPTTAFTNPFRKIIIPCRMIESNLVRQR